MHTEMVAILLVLYFGLYFVFCDDIQYFYIFRYEISNIKTLFYVDIVIWFIWLIDHEDAIGNWIYYRSKSLFVVYSGHAVFVLLLSNLQNNEGNDQYSGLKDYFPRACLGISARLK